MEIIPVIYILDGRCTALYKGDFEHKETYQGSPLEWARRFERFGADKIIISDLNAHKENVFKHKEKIREIIEKVSIPVWVEASFTTLAGIEEALEIVANKVIVTSPTLDFAKEAITAFGSEKIVIQIFANRAQLIDKKERKSADDFIEVVDYAEKLIPLGVKTVIYKDKRSEGILTNPNYDEIDRLYLTCGQSLKIYSSGGISELHHLKLLKKIGASGAIIGKAFFERKLDIDEAKDAVI